tara:strand:- start:114 stop:1778 length:1665 start_codon:yes stop_codon:yes gene_type:complete
MQIVIRLILVINILFLTLSFGYSQKKGGVKVIKTKRAKGMVIDGESVTKLYGDVHLRKDDVDFFCDSAIRYEKKHDFVAYGHVKMLKGDSITLLSNKLYHTGLTGISKFIGNVILKDHHMILTTEHLDYNKNTDLAFYYDKGVVIDGEVHLVSETGVYNVNSKVFNFYTDVVVIQPENRISSDTLRYNRLTGVVYFEGPTDIKNKDNDLYAEKGEYHTTTEDSYFSKHAVVETPKYILKGDSLYFNSKTTNGHVFGKVIIHSKKDSLFIFGKEAVRNGVLGTMKVFGDRALMEKIHGLDTTYILADTLFAIEDTLTHEQERILAYNDVMIYKQDLQAICDSLVNDFKDSTIYFYNEPIMWNDENQISGDTVKVVSVKKEISRVYTHGHSFTIKNHHGTQYDQIKGRNTVTYFKDNELEKVKVFGNGECLYYINDEEDKTFTGVNRIECSEMTVKFTDKAMSDITFLSLPDAHFYPPKLLTDDLTYLSDFVWQINKRPLLAEFREVQGKYIEIQAVEVSVKSKEDTPAIDELEGISRKVKKKKEKKGLLKKKSLN